MLISTCFIHLSLSIAGEKNKFSFSVSKGIVISNGNLIGNNILASPYTGQAAIDAALPDNILENERKLPVEHFLFEPELNSTKVASEHGLEISVLNRNNFKLFFGLNRSNFNISSESPLTVTFPINFETNSKAIYSRELTIRNSALNFGAEKIVRRVTDSVDLSIRSSLQLIRSSIDDWNYFEFVSGNINGKTRYDKYTLNTPNSYAVDLGLNAIYHSVWDINIELYIGFLFDISKSKYKIGTRDDNFISRDAISNPNPLWNGDHEGNAKILSTDGVTYIDTKSDFTSWKVMIKVGMGF